MALSMLFATYCAMIVLFLISYHYASSKYEQIRIGDLVRQLKNAKAFSFHTKKIVRILKDTNSFLLLGNWYLTQKTKS